MYLKVEKFKKSVLWRRRRFIFLDTQLGTGNKYLFQFSKFPIPLTTHLKDMMI